MDVAAQLWYFSPRAILITLQNSASAKLDNTLNYFSFCSDWQQLGTNSSPLCVRWWTWRELRSKQSHRRIWTSQQNQVNCKGKVKGTAQMNLFRFSVCRVVPVAELIVHPEHNRILQIHDIALLKLGLISLQILPSYSFQGREWTWSVFLLSAFHSMDRILMGLLAMSMVTFTFLD